LKIELFGHALFTCSQIAEMYNAQKHNHPDKSKKKNWAMIKGQSKVLLEY